MASLMDAIKTASKHAKSPPPTTDGRAGVSAAQEPEAEIPFFHHRDEDSPISLFSSESIEQGALNSVRRLMNSWDSRIPELEKTFQIPEDYMGEANRLFGLYKGLRVRLDSAVAYSIGDTLIRCRERFFQEGVVEGKTWTEFIKGQCQFSFRLGYDFINIASRLGELKGRSFSMEQLRAILQLTGEGFAVAALPPNAEDLSVKELMKLVEQEKVVEPKPEPNIGRTLNLMGPIVMKLDGLLSSVQEVLGNKEAKGETVVLSTTAQTQINHARKKLQDALATLDVLSSVGVLEA